MGNAAGISEKEKGLLSQPINFFVVIPPGFEPALPA